MKSVNKRLIYGWCVVRGVVKGHKGLYVHMEYIETLFKVSDFENADIAFQKYVLDREDHYSSGVKDAHKIRLFYIDLCVRHGFLYKAKEETKMYYQYHLGKVERHDVSWSDLIADKIEQLSAVCKAFAEDFKKITQDHLESDGYKEHNVKSVLIEKLKAKNLV